MERVNVVMSKKQCQENFDFVIYNYLSSQKEITEEKFKKDIDLLIFSIFSFDSFNVLIELSFCLS